MGRAKLARPLTAFLIFFLIGGPSFFGPVSGGALQARETTPRETSPSQNPSRQSVELQAHPGEVLTIDSNEEKKLHTVEVHSPGGKQVGTFQSFYIRNPDTAGPSNSAIQRGIKRVLVPFSSTADTGTYRLSFFTESGEVFEERSIEIVEREFRSETIALNYSLSELRSSDDPEKYNQAVMIQSIYGTFNSDRLPGGLNFRVPLPVKESGEYRITSHYGDRRIFSYSDGRSARSIHSGIDYAAPVETPVVSAEKGRVVLAEDRIISGYSVVIEHMPGVYSIYFHLHSLEVKKGEMVEKGERIGTVGMTGLATGPHLHWEVRVNGVAVDPAMLTQID